MPATTIFNQPATEHLLADLTRAAYEVTLRYDARHSLPAELQDTFLDAELDLWDALRRVLKSRLIQAGFVMPAEAAA